MLVNVLLYIEERLMYSYKANKNLAILILYVFTFSPSIAMQIEEDLETGNNQNYFLHLLSPQQKIAAQEDEKLLDAYITNIKKYNIKVEKTILQDENKVSLTLGSTSWWLSWFKEDYNSVFSILPSLQSLSLSLDTPHKELNLEELKNVVNLARNNASLVHFTSKNLGYWSSDLEKERAKCLLMALLYRNSLVRGVTKDFEYNFSLLDNPEEENAIVEGLQNALSLESIDLCFNEERGKSVIESIKESKSVNSIKAISFSFFDERLSSYDLNKLNSLFANTCALEFLYLEAPLDNQVLLVLAKHLKRPPFALTNLHLATNDWEESKQQLSEKGMGEFFHALTTNQNLRLLQLRFPLSSIQVLAEALKVNNALKILALPKENLGNEEIRSLVTGLKENTSITEIDISNNNITDEGADVLLDLLGVNKILTTLHLGGNKVSDSKKTKIRQFLRQRQFGISEEEKNQV